MKAGTEVVIIESGDDGVVIEYRDGFPEGYIPVVHPREDESGKLHRDLGFFKESELEVVNPVVSSEAPDLGDLMVVMLAGTLSGVRDRLRQDGFERSADLVGDLARQCDEFLQVSV